MKVLFCFRDGWHHFGICCLNSASSIIQVSNASRDPSQASFQIIKSQARLAEPET